MPVYHHGEAAPDRGQDRRDRQDCCGGVDIWDHHLMVRIADFQSAYVGSSPADPMSPSNPLTQNHSWFIFGMLLLDWPC